MTFPVTATLSDSLKIDIHLHEFFLGDRDRQCWTYLTKGLAEFGQREMALSLLVDDGADVDQFPKTPIKMFQLLGDYAAEGRLVDLGDATRLGKKGIFGFTSLFYVPAIQYDGLPPLDEYLGLMLVHQEEYDYAKQYGLTRLLSRIGKFCSSFPYPTWNTQVRPSLFPDSIREISMLADASHVLIEHSYIHKSGDVLQFQLHRDDAPPVLAALRDLPDDQAVILNCAFSPRCEASLYWQEGQEQPGAYAAPEAANELIGGSFIALGQGDSSDSGIVEDGYYANLGRDDWNRFREGVSDGNSIECSLGEYGRFLLDFVDVTARPKARHYEPIAVWQSIESTEPAVEQAAPPGTEKLLNHEFVNLSGENSLAQRVEQADLDRYIGKIQQMLAVALEDEVEHFDLTIELTVYPDKVDKSVTASIDLNPDFTHFIEEAIDTIDPCAVKAQIKFALPFTVNPTS